MMNKLAQTELKDVHLLPKPVKLVLLALLFVVVFVVAYFAVLHTQVSALQTAREQEITLKEDYRQKNVQLINSQQLEQELQQLRTRFDGLLRQLPTDAQIPDLLQELHQAASANGLRLDSLQAEPSEQRNMVVILPYRLSVSGSYEQVAQFVRDVGKLSRIVTMQSLNVKTLANNQIELQAVAHTYQAMSEGVATQSDESSSSQPIDVEHTDEADGMVSEQEEINP